MKVLYIGGTGEISYSCVQRGARLGQQITVFNRNRNGEPLPPSVHQLTGDIDDDGAYRQLADERFDVVCQFLAYDPRRVQRDIDTFSGKCGQYVFISSASAYRKPAVDAIITEAATPLLNAYWPYSQAKIEMEHLVSQACEQARLPCTIVRPSHTYRRRIPGGVGGGDHAAWRMLQGKPVVIQGDGTTLWTLTHSEDFAVGFCGLLGNSKAIGEAFHITNHLQAHTWNDIYDEIAAALGVEPRLVHVTTHDLIQFNPDWTGPLLGDKSWCAVFDNSKLFGVVGPSEPKIDLAQGMRRAVEHFRSERLPDYRPDEKDESLFDRIVERAMRS